VINYLHKYRWQLLLINEIYQPIDMAGFSSIHLNGYSNQESTLAVDSGVDSPRIVDSLRCERIKSQECRFSNMGADTDCRVGPHVPMHECHGFWLYFIAL